VNVKKWISLEQGFSNIMQFGGQVPLIQKNLLPVYQTPWCHVFTTMKN